ncbi:MAG: hypothetical protein ACYDB7_14835 [Mycobacteriales bacterium]
MERKTLNFDTPATWIRRYTQPGSLEHLALARVVGEPADRLTSESAVLVALVQYARARVEEEKLRSLYDDVYAEPALEADGEAAMESLEHDYAAFVGDDG